MKIKEKTLFFNNLLNIFEDVDYVKSTNLVGSILNKDINEVSDIDLVLIVDKLTKKKFDEIQNEIENFNFKNFNLKKNVIINNKFGPLKLDYKNNLIIHLMIYDLENHKDHVYSSPFTCFDWELTKLFSKKQLNDFYPVYKLMLNDFISSRRGIQNYAKDIKNKSIEYREYEFNSESNYSIVKQNFQISTNYQLEYFFHIFRNLIFNYLKFIESKNVNYENTFYEKLEFHLPEIFNSYKNILQELKKGKERFILSEKANFKNTLSFIEDFNKALNNIYLESNKIYLVRHQKTELNNGTFLGQKLDPGVIRNNELFKNNLNSLTFKDVFTSPSKRCLETLELFNINNYKTNEDLREINYGDAEGLTLEELSVKFPKIVEGWNNGIDSHFPNGENNYDVFKRVNKILNRIDKDTLIMTHQVPIRSVIGNYFSIDIKDWHKIIIPFGTPIEVLMINNKLYVNISQNLKRKILENI